eukprot:scaffold6692_cov148-Skeletonema_dohrnii-CCMP3373.AAC.2
MQGNEEKDNDKRKDGEDGWKWKDNGGNGAAAAAAASADALDGDGAAEDEDESSNMIIVPTKTEDGGSTITNQVRAYINNNNQNQGQETTSTRPDAFQMYSDNDTRMLRLLGIEPAGNPNEGEGEREDWRQLTGFTGIGEERRRSNGNDEGTPRRTRLSFELHLNAFENMLVGRDGELNMDDDVGQQQVGHQEGGQEQQGQQDGRQGGQQEG